MPAPDTATARDEMLARLKAAVDGSAYAGLSIIYDDAMADVPTDETPAAPPAETNTPPGKPWLRVGVRHADGAQVSLGSIGGKRRQEMSGLIFIQMFTPAGDGHKLADPLGDFILDVYRTGGATTSGVQFRSARRVEIGKDGPWFLTNLLIDFQYDLIR